MGRIREKRWRYGMEAFLFLSALLVADMLLCAVWGAFAAVPELFRTAFCLLGERVEVGPTQQIFSTPSGNRTEEYISGRFG